MNKVSTYYRPDTAQGIYLPDVIFLAKFSPVQSELFPPLLQNNKQTNNPPPQGLSLRELKQCDLEYCQREMEAGFEL